MQFPVIPSKVSVILSILCIVVCILRDSWLITWTLVWFCLLRYHGWGEGISFSFWFTNNHTEMSNIILEGQESLPSPWRWFAKVVLVGGEINDKPEQPCSAPLELSCLIPAWNYFFEAFHEAGNWGHEDPEDGSRLCASEIISSLQGTGDRQRWHFGRTQLHGFAWGLCFFQVIFINLNTSLGATDKRWRQWPCNVRKMTFMVSTCGNLHMAWLLMRNFSVSLELLLKSHV